MGLKRRSANAPPSTRNPSGLLAAPELWKQCVALAVLEQILNKEEWSRYYGYDPTWGPGEAVATMNNGSGDQIFIGFSKAGALLQGFAHESAMTPYRHHPPRLWPDMFRDVPETLASFRDEPAFDPEATTFCLWWTRRRGWCTGVRELAAGADPDGSKWMLAVYDGRPERYAEFVSQYLEVQVPVSAVADVYAHRPLTPGLVEALGVGNGRVPADDWLKAAGYGGSYPF